MFFIHTAKFPQSKHFEASRVVNSAPLKDEGLTSIGRLDHPCHLLNIVRLEILVREDLLQANDIRLRGQAFAAVNS